MRYGRFALMLLVMSLAGGAVGQPYPSRPVRIVVPYPPGGSPDVLARTLAQRVSESVGQQIITDNRPGAGGSVAAEAVMRASPDGYTLLIADSSVYSISPNLNPKLPYDTLRDFAPVSLAATSPIFLVANNALPVQNVKDLIALAKAKPGMPYGSSGNGTAHHLAMELIKSLSGIDLTHVPYKGAGQVVPAVLAGDVVVAFAGLNLVLPQAKAGKLKLLAVATGQRTPLLPDLPTVAEAGVPGFEITITLGLFAPAGTPREVIGKLSAEFVKALNTPDVRQRLTAMGVEPAGSTPEQFAEAIRTEIEQFGKLVRTSAARVE